jgi:hypothetical protein
VPVLQITIVLMLGLLVGGVSQAAAQTIGQVGPSAALGQLGTVNPSNPVFIFRPNPTGPFVVVPSGFPFSRETVPFGDEPHRLNNAHPMLPNAGLGYAVSQVWVPAQPIAMQVYVPAPNGVPATYQTQFAQIPGFYVTETTTGYLYPERWVMDQLSVGVYQWRKAPAQFVPR